MLIAEIITAIVTVITLLFAFATYYRDTKRKKKQDTLEAYTRLQNGAILDLVAMMPKEIEEICGNKRSVKYKELVLKAKEIEMFCAGLNNDIYDFDVFYEIAKDYFNSSTALMRRRLEIIMEQTRDLPDEYFENILKVWEKMDARRGK